MPGDESIELRIKADAQIDRLTHVPQRDALANAMCRHALTSDWFEKADAVLATLAEQGYTLSRAD